MCLQKSARILLFLTALAILGGCGALDSVLPSTGNYKINAKINDTSLDNFSILTSKDKIQPFFENPVFEDQDITELVVFLKDSRGLTTGYKVTYSLAYNNKDNNKKDESELQSGQDNLKTEKQDEKKKDKDEVILTGTVENNKEETKKDSKDDNKNDSKEISKADSKDNSKDNNKNDNKEISKVDSKENSKDNNKNDSKEISKADSKETSKDDNKKDDNKNDNKEISKVDSKENSKDDNKNDNKEVSKADNKETSKEETKKDNKESDKEKKDTLAKDTGSAEKIEYIKKDNEIIFMVTSLDKTLPFLPLPSDLPIGKYTLVFQVMGKNTILYKYEKLLFYIADAEFSFDGIQVHLPGIAENSQFIQNGNVILLDIKLNFDSRLEPYVVWYNGKKIIDEGRYSDGAGTLLWKAPEQNGFVSLRAEVFPSLERIGLAGYQKGISLLVSSKEVDMHLLSKDTPNLVQWYTFEGNLSDSSIKGPEKRVIERTGKNKLEWMPSSGTYGLASGASSVYKLPTVTFTNNEENENWQIISRFKPLSEGEIFSVQFEPADVTMTLSNKKSNLILTLTSALKTSSEVLRLPNEKEPFVTASVKFFIQDKRISAKLTLGKSFFEKSALIKDKEAIVNPISVEIDPDIDVDIDKAFKVTLGQQPKNPADNTQTAAVKKQVFTALWDELAILRLPPVKKVTAKNDAKEPIAEGTGTAAVKADPPKTIPDNDLVDNSNLSE